MFVKQFTGHEPEVHVVVPATELMRTRNVKNAVDDAVDTSDRVLRFRTKFNLKPSSG